MTSHDYAKKLRALAERLESAPVFDAPNYQENYVAKYGVEHFGYNDDKQGFLSAVRAMGSGRKVINGDNLDFFAADEMLRLSIYRTAVCKLIRPAEYDCPPLLSEDEERQVTAQSEAR